MDITDSCLDAETLAAWADGGLSDPELERAQTHVADCARCQALVGTLARINSAVPAAVAEPARRPWLAWLVPLTAAAAAVAVWVMVPQRISVPHAPTSQSQDAKAKPQEPAAQPELAESKRLREDLRTKATGQAAARAPEMRREAASPSSVDNLSKQETVSGTPAGAVGGITPSLADSQAAAANTLRASQSMDRLEAPAPREIVSPDPNVRWRIAGTVVQRSSNGGAAWEDTPAGVATQLLAGAAPSQTVCWLVGRAGVVLLSADGRNWRRLPFPEMTDLSVVRARDDRAASVTTADGRTFSTTDAGSTWTPGLLQGF